MKEKDVFYGHWWDKGLIGYGIWTYQNGDVYHGEVTDDLKEGYGHMRYANNDEYDGQWTNDLRHGEGVFKKASTGRIERRLYELDNLKKVLQVIW